MMFHDMYCIILYYNGTKIQCKSLFHMLSAIVDFIAAMECNGQSTIHISVCQWFCCQKIEISWRSVMFDEPRKPPNQQKWNERMNDMNLISSKWRFQPFILKPTKGSYKKIIEQKSLLITHQIWNSKLDEIFCCRFGSVSDGDVISVNTGACG